MRGRKKNHFIWSCILKDIASQTFGQNLFLNKTEKENVSEGNTLSERGKRTRDNTPSLNLTWSAQGVADSGPAWPTGHV